MEKKKTKEDFWECFKISILNFRGSKHIFKKQNEYWFDPELSSAIKKVDRVFLPLAIFVVGLVVLAVAALELAGETATIITCIVWLILNLFLISPLIYLAFCPVPVKNHIKRVCDLTPDELVLYETELKKNERLEKLLKKYNKMEEEKKKEEAKQREEEKNKE